LIARPFAAVLEKSLRQPVAIINKPGAGGAVGMQVAAVSKADGYTLMVTLSSISIMPEVDKLFGRPSTYKREDFAPIAMLTSDTNILVVKAESPWKNLAEFVADAKRRPYEIKYSSSGVYGAMHVPMELFAQAAGIQMKHLPTSGGGTAVTSLLGGHVDCLAGAHNVSLPHIKAGTLRVLACWGDKRMEAFPQIPSLKESGYNVEFSLWSGFFAPKATPAAALKILREATRNATDNPDFKAAMKKMEITIHYMDADEFQKYWDKEAAVLAKGVQRMGKLQ
ncbi:MAG TPA: tripartite tricarboxylate transporter substrate binding protein, partial [Candidatus Methylomirabilis sp.]|nr:tripartite tricarboxylate transporter substrate binding protein [Candidatus Methylomirabilis sp.]